MVRGTEIVCISCMLELWCTIGDNTQGDTTKWLQQKQCKFWWIRNKFRNSNGEINNWSIEFNDLPCDIMFKRYVWNMFKKNFPTCMQHLKPLFHGSVSLLMSLGGSFCKERVNQSAVYDKLHCNISWSAKKGPSAEQNLKRSPRTTALLAVETHHRFLSCCKNFWVPEKVPSLFVSAPHRA